MRAWMLLAALWPAVAVGQVAGPPSAPTPPHASGYRLDTRVSAGRETGDIRARIGDGRRAGQLSRSDTRALRREAGQIDTLANRYGENGLSDAEARELQVRAAVLRDQVSARRTAGFGNTGQRRR